MAALAKDRTNRKELLDAAGRIDASQKDEIEFMQRWLEERNEPGDRQILRRRSRPPAAITAPGRGPRGARAAGGMKGMATPEQMAALAAANGTEFDRLFLELMIKHHEGAVEMVEELTEQPGSAYEPALFEFTRDVTNDQNAEIERMNALLVGLSADPRASLEAGLRRRRRGDLRISRKSPRCRSRRGSSIPRTRRTCRRSGSRRSRPRRRRQGRRRRAATTKKTSLAAAAATATRARRCCRSRTRTWRFSGDVMVVGSYHGFNVYRLQGDEAPQLLVVGRLPRRAGRRLDRRQPLDHVRRADARPRRLRARRRRGSTRAPSASAACASSTSPIRRGRSRSARCRRAAARTRTPSSRATSAGSSSTTRARPACATRRSSRAASATSPATRARRSFASTSSRFPSRDPSRARIIDSPAVFADPATGVMAGLWRGGDHGDETQETSETNQCHDITVFPAAGHRRGRVLGQRHRVRHPRSAEAEAHRRRRRQGLRVLALGDVQQRRHEGHLHRRVGRRRPRRAAARTTRSTGAPTPSTTWSTASSVSQPLQDAGAASRRGKLRRAQRLDRAGAGARHHGPELVPGRHLGVGFHGLRGARRDRVLRSRPDRRGGARRSAATGRRTGTTAASTRRRSRAASTCSRCSRASS